MNYNLPDQSQNNPYRYSNFSCIDPVAVFTDEPWYPIKNTCPCDPSQSNPTGRGFTPCPFGVNFQEKQINKSINEKKQLMTVVSDISGPNYQVLSVPVQRTNVTTNGVTRSDVIPGSMFPTQQYTVPQVNPRPLVKIGQEWRSAWA